MVSFLKSGKLTLLQPVGEIERKASPQTSASSEGLEVLPQADREFQSLTESIFAGREACRVRQRVLGQDRLSCLVGYSAGDCRRPTQTWYILFQT